MYFCVWILSFFDFEQLNQGDNDMTRKKSKIVYTRSYDTEGYYSMSDLDAQEKFEVKQLPLPLVLHKAKTIDTELKFAIGEAINKLQEDQIKTKMSIVIPCTSKDAAKILQIAQNIEGIHAKYVKYKKELTIEWEINPMVVPIRLTPTKEQYAKFLSNCCHTQNSSSWERKSMHDWLYETETQLDSNIRKREIRT